MSDCCKSNDLSSETSKLEVCPSCNVDGKKVKIITLKSLLKPMALNSLNANLDHYFCSTSNCEVVYFDSEKKSYFKSDIKVQVFQKDSSLDVPVCYCFDWTKGKLQQSVQNELASQPVEQIRKNIKANRCGCEVNNPQGSCCLANVTTFIDQLS
ncbi:(2Fe-2S)-binding protein [Bacillus sp. RG28]|uniref:(2Fe-2S)-binding protein n=1 Tax=Gottfriedia endophytica TaxID=2820819 RepID=A0A940NQP0_9BACI|nr:(2Fe-2S)-binding protein [Gottfriedia endophytica]MBP0726015.1 (2Fe-2S)-binding protein [Gottfriedia endophytica]